MSEIKKPELLKEEGTFNVAILDPYWEASKDDAQDQMCLVLPCHTHDGRVAYHRLYFNNKIASKGRNMGRAIYEISAEQCIELGMTPPFDPARIAELNDKECEIVMESETYQGKTSVRSKWLNPLRSKKMDAATASEVWAKMTGGKKAQPEKRGAANDDLPF